MQSINKKTNMQIVLINRKDKRQYLVDIFGNITNKWSKALIIDNDYIVARNILKYLRAFKIIIITSDGEVIKKYD